MSENYNIPAPKKHPLSLQIDPALFEKATDEEKKQTDVMAESTTFFKDGMKRLRRNPLAVFSFWVLAVLIVIMLFAPVVVPYSYEEIITVEGVRDKGAANLAPFQYSEKEQAYMDKYGVRIFPHIMGTDELCRDYFIRVVYGTRVSFLVGIFASLMVLVIGTIYGAISGYFGGRVDLIMMRIVDIIYSLPDPSFSPSCSRRQWTSRVSPSSESSAQTWSPCSSCSAFCTGSAWREWSAARS